MNHLPSCFKTTWEHSTWWRVVQYLVESPWKTACYSHLSPDSHPWHWAHLSISFLSHTYWVVAVCKNRSRNCVITVYQNGERWIEWRGTPTLHTQDTRRRTRYHLSQQLQARTSIITHTKSLPPTSSSSSSPTYIGSSTSLRVITLFVS